MKWGRAVNARKDQKGKASIPFLFRTFTLALSLFKVREKKTLLIRHPIHREYGKMLLWKNAKEQFLQWGGYSTEEGL